jgi:hypothetical protein
MINPFKKVWKKIVSKDLGPLPFDPYKSPDEPIFAAWTKELYGVEYNGDTYVCKDGQCIPFEHLKAHIMSKSEDVARKEKMQ